jgi:hypothetical protein
MSIALTTAIAIAPLTSDLNLPLLRLPLLVLLLSLLLLESLLPSSLSVLRLTARAR